MMWSRSSLLWRRRNNVGGSTLTRVFLGSVQQGTAKLPALHSHFFSTSGDTQKPQKTRRLRVLRARKDEKKKRKVIKLADPFGKEELGSFFDLLAPTFAPKKIKDVTTKLNKCKIEDLLSLLQLMGSNNRDRFKSRVCNLLLIIPNKGRALGLFKPKVTVEDLQEVLIAAKDRANLLGMNWETDKKHDQPPVNDSPKHALRTPTIVATHLQKSLPDDSLKALSSLLTAYVKDERKIRLLLPYIQPAIKEHFHFVAAELAHYFSCPDADTVTTSERYTISQQKWSDIRESFIQCLLNVQEALRALPRLSAIPELVDLDNPERSVKVKAKEKKQRHVRFEVIAIENEPTDVPPSLARTVIIDNLPIDITAERIISLYSRCGDLDDVQVFQRREDVNPGKLSKTVTLQLRKEQIHELVGGREWTRPKTPLYALLTFADDAGYEVATQQSLQLFGMLIDKHDVRSIPCQNLKSLYIDNLPVEMRIPALENRLGKEMDKYWTVCLEAGQANSGVADTCEIKFPSFESAYVAHGLLRDKFKTNFLKTPRDAEKWWTKEFGFG